MSNQNLGIEKGILAAVCFFIALLVIRSVALTSDGELLDAGVIGPLASDNPEARDFLQGGESLGTTRDSILPDSETLEEISEVANVVIRAVGADGNWLVDVEVWSLDQYVGKLQGVTDREGQLLASFGLGEVVRLQGVSAYGISQPISLEVSETTTTVLLEIGLPQAIRGVVTRPDGNPVGAGVRVLAARSDQVLSREIAQSSYLAKTLQRVVETDQYGEFAFERLPAGQAFHLTAGGNGLVNFPAVMAVPSGTVDVEVPTEHSYAVIVSVTDASGFPPTVSDDLRYGVGGKLVLPSDAPVRRLPGYVVGAYLAGLRVPVRVQESRASELMLFSSAVRVDALGLFQINYSLPGYSPFWGEFEAPYMAGELLEVKFNIGEPEVDFGEIEIELVGLGDGLDRSDCQTVGGYLQLFQQGRPLLSFGIPDLAADSLRFDAIPYGTYDLAVVLAQGLVRFPSDASEPNYVSVSAEPAIIRVDSSDLGGVEIEAVDQRGVPYTGALRLSIARAEDVTEVDGILTMRSMAPVILRGPPFRIVGLPSGKLVFQPQFPFSHSGPIPSVEISPGGIQELVMESGS